MAVKWIVTDMDGTLLNEKDCIMPKTKEYLLNCQKQGIRLILASGRSYPRLMPYVEELEMKKYGGRLIEVNGMAVNDLDTGERTIFGQLNRQEIGGLFSMLQSLEVEIQGYQDAAIYYWIPESQMVLKERERSERNLPESYPWVGGSWTWVTDSRAGYPKQVPIDSVDELPQHLNKIGCLAAPETIREVQKLLIEKYSDSFEMVRTCPRLIEISPKGITKGNTLKQYMKQQEILPEEVMVFGDGENDVEMFHEVKYSIAMGNAEAFIQKQAYAVTKSNREEGIAAALERFQNILDVHGQAAKRIANDRFTE